MAREIATARPSQIFGALTLSVAKTSEGWFRFDAAREALAESAGQHQPCQRVHGGTASMARPYFAVAAATSEALLRLCRASAPSVATTM